MRTRGIVILLLLTLTTTSPAAESEAPTPGSVADRVFEVMAGSAWEKARYIAFSFNPERDGKIAASYPQRLDRYTGDYQVSGKDREGRDFLVVMNVNTKQGRAWLNGAEVADPKDLVTMGYRRFINDTYWLLMPLKLRDPGTHLDHEGVKTDECGRSFDVLKLSFDTGVGLTPGDNYWVWVNRETGLIDFWEMRLEGSKPEDPPRRWRMQDYERRGGLILSLLRAEEGSATRIRLDDVEVRNDVPEGAFRK